MAAALVTRSEVCLRDMPRLTDIDNFLQLAKALGAVYSRIGRDIYFDASQLRAADLDPKVIAKLRASSYLIPVLATISDRFCLPQPGGCAIGPRPLNFHLGALEKLGVIGEDRGDCYCFRREKLTPGTIVLPFQSFGATVNTILLASVIPGVTTLSNPAQEPEIHQLTDFMTAKGVDITWVGDTLVIAGRREFNRIEEFVNCGDRIAAATYALLGTGCGSCVELENAPIDHLKDVLNFFDETEIEYDIEGDRLTVLGSEINAKLSIAAEPFPGFSTDILPLVVPIFAASRGLAVLKDKVYPNRLAYIAELQKTNANIALMSGDIIVLGSQHLRPSEMSVTDLRGGAAELLLATRIDGRSAIDKFEVLNRGYENLVENLRSLGVRISE